MLVVCWRIGTGTALSIHVLVQNSQSMKDWGSDQSRRAESEAADCAIVLYIPCHSGWRFMVYFHVSDLHHESVIIYLL